MSSLLQLLGLGEVAPKQADEFSEQAQQFREKFLNLLKQVNENLQTTSVRALPDEHAQATGQRDSLIAAYQKVLTQFDAESSPKVEKDADRVMQAAEVLSEKSTVKAESAKAQHQEWLKKEAEFDDAEVKIAALEETDHPKATVLRKLVDAIREYADGKKFGDALTALTQVGPKVDSLHAEAAKNSGAESDTTNQKVRTVPGGGGYVYEQHVDGSIFIVESPKGGNNRVQVKEGTKGYEAILKEIGPLAIEGDPLGTPPPAPPAGPTEASALFDSLAKVGGSITEAIGDVAEDVGSLLGFGGNDGNDAADPSGTPPASPVTPTIDPEPSKLPTGDGIDRAPMDETKLQDFLKGVGNPQVDAIASELADMQTKFKSMDKESTEEKGAARDELVESIGQLRQKIEALDSAGIDPALLPEIKARLHRAANDVTPFYSQGRNIDLLEGKAQAKELGTETSVNTRTCNLTSLGMALESLGKSAAHYDNSKRADVQAAAKIFSKEVKTAKLTVDGGVGWDAMKGMRFTDFLQLAAIAEKMKSGTTDKKSIESAARSAWEAILGIDTLKKLAGRFGVSGTDKWFSLDPTKPVEEGKEDKHDDAWQLRKLAESNTNRREVTKLAEIRNELEGATDEGTKKKLQKKYDNQLKKVGGKVSEDKDEKKIPLAAYKEQLIKQVGSELDRGCAVVVLIRGHYVRLQGLYDDHVIVDDPARQTLANLKVTYEEAREMGYFFRWLVLK